MNNLEETSDMSSGDPWKGAFRFVCWVYFSVLLLLVGLRILFSTTVLLDLDRWALEVFWSVASQILIMTFVPIVAMHVYFRKKDKENQVTIIKTASRFGLTRPAGRVIAWAFLLGAVLFLFNVFVSSFFNGILMIFGYRFPAMMPETFYGVGGLFIGLLMIAVLPGLCEEVTHRGMLLKGFESKMGTMRAILWTSVLFGFMHLNIVQFFYATILGYMIALAVIATRNLWVGVIIHFVNNGIATYMSFAGRYKWFGHNALENLAGLFDGFGFIIYFGLVVGLFLAIMAIMHMFAKNTYNKNKRKHIEKLVRENPMVLMRVDGGVYTIEEFVAIVDAMITKLSKWRAIKFYIDASTLYKPKPMNLDAKEKTLFVGVMVLGSLVTVFTLVWGFL